MHCKPATLAALTGNAADVVVSDGTSLQMSPVFAFWTLCYRSVSVHVRPPALRPKIQHTRTTCQGGLIAN